MSDIHGRRQHGKEGLQIEWGWGMEWLLSSPSFSVSLHNPSLALPVDDHSIVSKRKVRLHPG